MHKKLPVQLLVVAVLLVGGIVGFFQVVPVLTVNLGPIGRLMVTNPEVKGITAAASYRAPSPITATNLPSMEQGYALDPGQTGGYTGQWFGNRTVGGSVAMFLELLPNTVLAKQAATEQSTQNMSDAVLGKLKATVKSRFTIAGVPNSSAVFYNTAPQPATKTTTARPAQPTYTGLIRVDRVVVRADLQGPTITKAALTQLMQREVTLIERNLPFWKDMASKTNPVGSTLLWFGGLLVLIGLVFFIPFTNDRIKAAQVAREEARRRYQLQSRGSKVVRRQRVVRR